MEVALNLMKMPEFALKKPANFVVSSSWCNWFMNLHNLCLRACTRLAQKLTSQVENKVGAFQQHIIQLRKKYDFDLSQIGNLDETPVSFSMPANYTIDVKGAKSWSKLLLIKNDVLQ